MARGGYRHRDGTNRLLLCGILLAGLAALLTVVLIPGDARAEGYGEGSASVRGCNGTTVTMQVREQEMLQLINDRRKAIGRPAFCVHPKLQQAARGHSADMVARGYYSHRSPEGEYAFHRAREGGYEGGQDAGVWENLAQARVEGPPRVTFEAWMNSPNHRFALQKDYSSSPEIGIGAVNGEWVHWTTNMSDAYVPPVEPPAAKLPEAEPKPKAKPNTAPRIGKLRILNKKVRRGKYTHPHIRAIVRDRETNLRRGQIQVRVDGKRMRVRYNRRTDRIVVRTQRLKRGKHILLIRAADGEKKVVKRVKFRVR